jgi:hypothetical protein
MTETIESSRDIFPRSAKIGRSSPLYWAANKDRYIRQLLIQDIQDVRKRDLIVIFHGPRAEIDDADIGYLAELLTGVETPEFDLLLETAGGFSNSTDALLELLDNTKKRFHAIIVSAAKSNGTLLSLGAKTLTMGYASQLGPIDPMLDDIPAKFLATDQQKAKDFTVYLYAKDALSYQQDLAERALSRGLMKDKTKEQRRKAVNELCYYHNDHGAVIDVGAARDLFGGTSVIEIDEDDHLWRQLWLLRCLYKQDMDEGRINKIYEGKRVSASIKLPR